MMEAVYHSFLKLVANSRNLKIEEVDKVARGRIWAGKTARELKLVDQIGGLLDAIDEAKKLAKIPPSEKVDIKIYPRKQSFLDFVFNVIDTKIHNPLKIDIEARLQEYQHFFPALIVPYRIVIH
jgi:protease-4